MSWLSGLFGGWMLHPALFAAGSAAVASPIIIHLLNKRKFKTVDWAAMDFLVEADKKNRRRIRLENLLLLLLRCAIVVLIALLLARPSRSLEAFGGVLESVRHERIVLLDDSLSMQARGGGRSSLETAKSAVIKLVRGLVAEGRQDTLTVLVTSQPEDPLYQGVPLNEEILDEVVARIEQLSAVDVPADYQAALDAIQAHLEKPSEVNRALYIISDLRSRDWTPAADSESSPAVAARLAKMSAGLAGCVVLDVGTQETGNLAVTAVESSDKVLVSGVPARFEVTVHNFGEQPAAHLEVRFQPEGSIAMIQPLDRIAPGGSETVPFTFTFALPERENASPEPVAVRVEVATADSSADRLAADNVYFYPARLSRGIRTLLVDGDVTAEARRSETFFLQKALAPPGDVSAGIRPRVVSAAEFESLSLDEYQVVYLCNLDRISESRLESLEEWVDEGGGLALLLGDQLFDVTSFNEELYREGKGLSPVRVESIDGDESEQTWVQLDIVDARHDVVKVYAGDNNPFLEGVKIFRWWHTEVPPADLDAGKANVLARMAGQQKSPAIVDKPFGEGRVTVLATAADRDWSTWPQDPSYVIFFQDLTRALTRQSAGTGSLRVGQPLVHPVDLARHRLEVSLRLPRDERVPLQPVPPDDSQSRKPNADAIWQIRFDDVSERGFYRAQLKTIDDEPETALFAANLDSSEGNLLRAGETQLQQQLDGAAVTLVSGEELLSRNSENTRGELWPYILAGLVALLCGEQLLAWFMGTHR